MTQEEYVQGKWYWFEDNSLVAIVRFKSEGNGILDFISNELYTITGSALPLNKVGVLSLQKKFIKGLATPAQIEQCLKAYAEKNGYVEGACVKSIVSDEKYILGEISECGYNTMVDYFWLRGVRVYKDGKWAEIVAHAPSVQDKQDQELTDSIHEYLTNQDL